MKDTVKFSDGRCGKMLRDCSVRELHNDLCSGEHGLPEVRDASGEIIVSDTSLRTILKNNMPYLKKATEQTDVHV